MKKISILYKNKTISTVLILPHKNSNLYSYVNLTKGHICPCKFTSIQEAIDDLNNYDNIIGWWEEVE